MRTLSLEAGKAAQSPQTGFIHRGDLIPIYENLCFALSLFRTRTAEEIQEGKRILGCLFPFQIEGGGFPHSLHEYPHAASTHYQLLCALPLHWIYKHFHHVIEPGLREKLRNALQQILPVSGEGLSPCFRILFKAFLGEEPEPMPVSSSSEWGILLLAYQLLEEKPSWILEGALCCWHPELMTYYGRALQEYQRETAPETTLYDLFMCAFHGKTPQRLLKSHPIHLQASLIFPFNTQFSPPFSFKLDEGQAKITNGFHHMRLLWGSPDAIYSFVCQDTRHSCQMKKENCFFTYPQEMPEEKEQMELVFYSAYLPGVSFTVDGDQATVFELGQTVKLHTPEKTLALTFSLEKGEGVFMGHISRGNRPSQVALKGPQDFTAYDWKIGLRTITRSSDCIIQLNVL